MDERIRFSRLAYLTLDVSDVAASAAFYGGLVGLEIVKTSDREARLRCSSKPIDVMLIQGERPGLRRISFELEGASQIDVARAAIEGAGLDVEDVPQSEAIELGFLAGIRCRAPGTGLEVELIAGFGEQGSFEPSVAKIERLGHVVLNISDFPSALDFWTKTLNFLVSDAVPDRIAFLRCFPSKYHHSLALISTPQDGYNHVNFMVSDIDDVGKALNRMKKADVPIVFGPGRHEPSGSIFLYFLDPDGMTAEYSFGMEEFPEQGAREPRTLDPKPEVLDMWGSVPDERFGRSGAILAAEHA